METNQALQNHNFQQHVKITNGQGQNGGGNQQHCIWKEIVTNAAVQYLLKHLKKSHFSSTTQANNKGVRAEKGEKSTTLLWVGTRETQMGLLT